MLCCSRMSLEHTTEKRSSESRPLYQVEFEQNNTNSTKQQQSRAGPSIPFCIDLLNIMCAHSDMIF